MTRRPDPDNPLTDPQTRALIALVDVGGRRGGRGGEARLAESAGLSRSGLLSALRALHRRGFVQTSRRVPGIDLDAYRVHEVTEAGRALLATMGD